VFRIRRGYEILFALLLTSPFTGVGAAQAPPPSPVRFTEARSHDVQREVQLPGTVVARRASVVASEVAGRVEGLDVREGRAVDEGQVLARVNPRNLELQVRALGGQLEEASARRDRAKRLLGRAEELRADSLISDQDFDTAFSEFHAWEGRVAQLTADLDRARLDLDRCEIQAPFSGVVVAERTEAGQWLSVGAPVVEIVSLDEIELRVEVPEDVFAGIELGSLVPIRIRALGGEPMAGTVSALVPRGDPRARTFPVKIAIENPEHRIGVGMLAEASLPVRSAGTTVIVPKDAVVSEGPSRVVYVIGEDDTVAPVSVVPGEGTGAWVVVTGEVRAGARVVTRGNERLRPGQKVAGTVLEYDLP
jgi:RND family efflux transporter MFP subunit